MITSIEEINAWRRQHGLTEFLLEAKRDSDLRPQPMAIANMNEFIKEYEKSPKRAGNKAHFALMLSNYLTKDHIKDILNGTRV